MNASVVVDLSTQPEFPNKPNGEPPKVELVRHQVKSYIDGFTAAKRRQPERVVILGTDYAHCVRRVLSRMQRPRRLAAKTEWQEARKNGSKILWRDARPLPITEASLTWAGIPIEQVGYSRFRPTDRS